MNGKLAVQAETFSGNSSAFKMEGEARLDYLAEQYTAFAVLTYEHLEGENQNLVDHGFWHLRYVHNLSPKIKGELFTQQEFDKVLLLQNRFLYGGGLRFIIRDPFGEAAKKGVPLIPPFFTLYGGIGFMSETETLNLPGGTVTVDTVRNTNYVTFNWFEPNKYSIVSTTYIQPNLADFSDYRILTETGFAVALNEYMAFETSISYRFDSAPPQGVKQWDIKFNNGIGIAF